MSSEEREQRDILLDEFYHRISRFDSSWLIKKFDTDKLLLLRENFREEQKGSSAGHFVLSVLKIFKKDHPLSNLCLALGSLDLYESAQKSMRRPITFKVLMDFIFLKDVNTVPDYLIKTKKPACQSYFGPEKNKIRKIDFQAPVMQGLTNIYLWKIKKANLLTDSLPHKTGIIRW